MATTINYNSDSNEPTYKQFRLTISNDMLVAAIEDQMRKSGYNERELCREAIISYLEEKVQTRTKLRIMQI